MIVMFVLSSVARSIVIVIKHDRRSYGIKILKGMLVSSVIVTATIIIVFIMSKSSS
jgi:hypothetical protein